MILHMIRNARMFNGFSWESHLGILLRRSWRKFSGSVSAVGRSGEEGGDGMLGL